MHQVRYNAQGSVADAAIKALVANVMKENRMSQSRRFTVYVTLYSLTLTNVYIVRPIVCWCLLVNNCEVEVLTEHGNLWTVRNKFSYLPLTRMFIYKLSWRISNVSKVGKIIVAHVVTLRCFPLSFQRELCNFLLQTTVITLNSHILT